MQIKTVIEQTLMKSTYSPLFMRCPLHLDTVGWVI